MDLPGPPQTRVPDVGDRGTDAGPDDEVPWSSLARRRRCRRRALLLGAPCAALVGAAAAGGPQSWPGLVALTVLAALVLTGWWWVRRSTGTALRWERWRSPRHSSPAEGAGWQHDLDVARAEYALRHHVHVGEGARRRIQDLAERDARFGRSMRWIWPCYAAFGVLRLVQAEGAWDVLLGASWLVLAAVAATRARIRARRARRWLQDPPHAAVPASLPAP